MHDDDVNKIVYIYLAMKLKKKRFPVDILFTYPESARTNKKAWRYFSNPIVDIYFFVFMQKH